MEMLLTTAAFVLLTALMVWLHLRGRRSPLEVSSCPRCHRPVPTGARLCPGCGAPAQAFEIVTAVTAPAGGDPKAVARRHAVVRPDLCVGCGGCVSVCPSPGAITLVNRFAVVDPERCEGYGACVEACPTGAVFLGTGDTFQEIEVPDLDANFQSNVPGLYIVGELGGRGLIKHAINEARLAVEHIAAVLPRRDSQDGMLDVAIVGSGPAGLSAGLEAHRAGLRYMVLEQGALADTIRKYPRRKVLLAEPVHLPLYGELWVADTSKESLLSVWETIVARTGLDVRPGHRVTDVAVRGESFELATSRGPFVARTVVLAMGRRGTPRRLGIPGEDLSKVVYDIMEMEAFAGRRVLVVGGGDSAVESAIGLARQKGTEVTLSYRGDSFQRAKDRNLKLLEASARERRVTILPRSRVLEILDQEVRLEVDGRPVTLPNDDVVVRIGGDPPGPLLTRIGVRTVRKSVPLAGLESNLG